MMHEETQKRELVRIIIPAVVAIFLFIFSSFSLFLPRFEKSLFEDKKVMIRELVMSSWHMIQHLDREVGKGTYSLEQAQDIAANHLRNMRYGIDNKEYFWISDFAPTLIMHPYRPDLEGTDLANYTDSAGTKLLAKFVEITKEKGQGFVPYMWQWKDDQDRIVPKISFVKEYKPWGWIIGTGIYLEDVETQIAAMTQRLIVASIIILILVTLLSWYQVYRAMITIKLRQAAENELSEYKDQLEIKVKARTDELSKAYALLESLIDSIPDLIFYKNKESVYLGCNNAFCEFVGGPKSEIINKTDFDLFPEGVAENFREMDRIMLDERGGEIRNEEWVSFPNGKKALLETLKTPYYSPSKEILGLIGISRDITARKQNEEEKAKLIGELQKTIGEIKTLSGLLPICASCKNIRDDKGYWNKIETYIAHHSEAEFTHSICQECAKKLYPNLVDENGNL